MYTIIAIFSFITLVLIAREETFAEALGYDEENHTAFFVRIIRAFIAGLPLAALVYPAAENDGARLFALSIFTAIVFASAIYETHRITSFGYDAFIASQIYGEAPCPNPEELRLPLFFLEQPLERYLEANGWTKQK